MENFGDGREFTRAEYNTKKTDIMLSFGVLFHGDGLPYYNNYLKVARKETFDLPNASKVNRLVAINSATDEVIENVDAEFLAHSRNHKAREQVEAICKAPIRFEYRTVEAKGTRYYYVLDTKTLKRRRDIETREIKGSKEKILDKIDKLSRELDILSSIKI